MNREELSEDDKAKNLRWVAVGKKGTRKLIKKVWIERVNRQAQTYSHNNKPPQNSRKRTADQAERDLAAKKQRNQGGQVGEHGEEEEVMQEETLDM